MPMKKATLHKKQTTTKKLSKTSKKVIKASKPGKAKPTNKKPKRL